MHKIRIISVLILIGFSLSVLGCKKNADEKVVIRINDYQMTLDNFLQEYSELNLEQDTPQAREAFIDNVITRKILLQEAQRQGLDEKKSFLREIERFWEQSLLKIVIDEKMKGLSSSLKVEDSEIQDFYTGWKKENPDDVRMLADLRETIKWQLLKEKQDLLLEAWLKKMKDESKIIIDRKNIGLGEGE